MCLEVFMAFESRSDMFKVRTGAPGTINAFQQHVERYIGKIATTFHEQKSDFMHVDVHVIAPTSQRNYFTCVTSGMSDLPMDSPNGCPRYAELLICLPPNWPMTKEDFVKSKDAYWPILWLKQAARYPYQANTYLSIDHSLPNGDPPEPLGGNTEMAGMIIGPPFFFDEELFMLRVDDEKKICFLQLFPIYEKEMEYKIKYGAEKFWHNIFEACDGDLAAIAELMIDPRRKCFVP